jgi:nucleoside-diphosphate-sugar epimerase
MKVLITGSDGYIGTMLSQLLKDKGHQVTGLDTGFFRDGWLYENGIIESKALLDKDIRRVTGNELQGYDAIVHLAELSNDPLGTNNPEVTYSINHRGSVSLAKKAKKAGIKRFIYSSSCSVYGRGSKGYLTEKSQVNPQTAYARCKAEVESEVAKLSDKNFSPVFLRNATAYGSSPRMRFDLVLNNLAGLAWTSKEIKMISDGTPWRPLVHVLDICQAIACALEAPKKDIHNQIFNVGDTKENYQVRDIAEIVTSAIPGCKLTFGKNDGDNRSYKVSFEKINTKLPGFKCKRNVKKGTEQLLRIFRDIDMNKETFEFRAYTRLKQLKYLIQTKKVTENLFWS